MPLYTLIIFLVVYPVKYWSITKMKSDRWHARDVSVPQCRIRLSGVKASRSSGVDKFRDSWRARCSKLRSGSAAASCSTERIARWGVLLVVAERAVDEGAGAGGRPAGGGFEVGRSRRRSRAGVARVLVPLLLRRIMRRCTADRDRPVHRRPEAAYPTVTTEAERTPALRASGLRMRSPPRLKPGIPRKNRDG